jgi:hypothetical protein
MQDGQKFCPECGAQKVVAVPVPPSPTTSRSASAGDATTDAPFVLLIVGAVVALIVIGVLMFTTPHATYEGNVNNGGTVTQGAVTTSCISAWNEMVGNFPHQLVPTDQYALYDYEQAGDSCYTVIHGRQHLAILFLLVALGFGIGAVFRYRVIRRRGVGPVDPKLKTLWTKLTVGS